MRQVAAAAPKLPFFLYDIDFVTGVTCKYQISISLHLVYT